MNARNSAVYTAVAAATVKGAAQLQELQGKQSVVARRQCIACAHYNQVIVTRADEVTGKRRERLDTLAWKRPRCPKCGSAALRKYRSLADQGDGSALAWVRCGNTECGHRFRIVME